MLKKVIGAKGIGLLAGLIMVVSLSGCGNDLMEQDSDGTIIYEEESSGDQEAEHSEQEDTENKSDSTETKATTKEETPGTAQSETKETTTQSDSGDDGVDIPDAFLLYGKLRGSYHTDKGGWGNGFCRPFKRGREL